jgi:hypothetical protein
MALFRDSGSACLQPVQTLRVAVENNFAFVSWEPPSLGPVARQYVVQVRMAAAKETDPTWKEMYRTVDTCCEMDLSSLRVDTNYELSIVSLTIRGDGPRSDCTPFTTPAQRPSTAPGSISLVDRTSDTLRLKWTPPSQPNGTVLSYNVYFDELGKEDFECISVLSTNVRLDHLFPGAWYRVQG